MKGVFYVYVLRVHRYKTMGLNTLSSQDDLLPRSNITIFRVVYTISKMNCLVRKVNMSGYNHKFMLFFCYTYFSCIQRRFLGIHAT